MDATRLMRECKKLEEEGIFMKRFRKDEDGCQVTTATVKTWIENSKNATRECLGLKAYIGQGVGSMW